MKTSLYIGDGLVSAAEGTDKGSALHVSACADRELPGGVVSGGRVNDEAALTAALQALFAENGLRPGKVELVVSGANCFVNTLDAPLLPEKKMLPLLQRQFARNLESFTDPICDYTPFAPAENGGVRLLCVAMERAAAASYVRCARAAGLKVTGMEIGLCAASRLVERMQIARTGSVVFAMCLGESMFSLLFVDGQYSFMDRSTLRETRGTPAAAVEIARNLARLLQFHSGQRIGEKVSGVWLCGLAGEEPNFCGDISDMLEAQATHLTAWPGVVSPFMQERSIPVGDYAFCLGSLLRDKNRDKPLSGGVTA